MGISCTTALHTTEVGSWGVQRFDGDTAFQSSPGGFFQGSVEMCESSPCPSKHRQYSLHEGQSLGEQVNILPAPEGEDTTCVCSFQGHDSLPSAGSSMSLVVPKTGVSTSHPAHEVSGARAPLSSVTATSLFSQPSLAGFLKGLHSQA